MILSFLTSAIGGSLIGQLGSFANKFISIHEKKVDNAHELKLQHLNQQTRGMELESEAAIAGVNASTSIRNASYAHDSAVGESYRWVNAVLRLTRVVLTIGLIGITAFIVWKFFALKLGVTVAMEVIALTSMAVSWWFGDRRK